MFQSTSARAIERVGDAFLAGYISSILERDLHWERDSDALHGETEAFPVGDLFEPLLADPKQPQFFVNIDRFKSTGVTYTMASVGFGETFGLVRFLGSREKNGLQLSVAGALFAQLNMETPSSDLINADYTIGFPVDYRYGDNSLRLRIYQQSSHLGDELLQRRCHHIRWFCQM